MEGMDAQRAIGRVITAVWGLTARPKEAGKPGYFCGVYLRKIIHKMQSFTVIFLLWRYSKSKTPFNAPVEKPRVVALSQAPLTIRNQATFVSVSHLGFAVSKYQ